MNHVAMISRIRRGADKLQSVADAELRTKSLELQHYAMTGQSVDRLVIDGFPLVIEASRRTLGLVHYDVQLQCGIEMSRGKIAEMKTGEGKTLTASLAGYLMALYGKGLHLVTFNDYLAERDCEFLRPLYRMLGLTVDVLTADVPPEQRRRAYQCDITYGSAKEFGFDFLRDRLQKASSGDPGAGVMRGTNYALIDEADSILIDEARTPLIIGMINQSEEEITQSCFRWAAEHAEKFVEKEHYKYDALKQKVTLNFEGIKLARRLPQNDGTKRVSIRQLYEYLQNSIKVQRDFKLDKHYAIRDGEIVIIDEFTGRPAEGRQWQDGIHQSVQAKEGVEITPATRQAAGITIQSFARRYTMFCGMTGTAWTSRREIKKVYKKSVVRIPTHRPVIRKQLPPKVFQNQADKFKAIALAASEKIKEGRPVLIGSRSVGKSELLAKELEAFNLEFQILNANHLEREAEIVEQAGQSATITIATNMAGRGTDIKLAEPMKLAGGLHVILTEIHESERIDQQLFGRSSRQGDPGSYQVFVALDDEILKTGFGEKKAKQIAKGYQNLPSDRLDRLFGIFRQAQKKTERRYLTDRLIVLKSDVEKQKSLFETGQDPYLNVVSG